VNKCLSRILSLRMGSIEPIDRLEINSSRDNNFLLWEYQFKDKLMEDNDPSNDFSINDPTNDRKYNI
jgi:hypothetical protein